MTYELKALRAREFPWAERGESIYLDHASTGPIPVRSQDAIASLGARRAEPFRLQPDDFFPVHAKAREAAARLIGAKPSTIALMTNTSHGVNLAARSLPYGKGDVILSTHGEFPANVYPWMAAARARGAEFRMLPLAGDWPDEAAIMRAIETDPRVKVVSLSWVSFWSGHRFDIAAIGAACRARGIHFHLDAIQGLGPLALEGVAANVDVLSCGAQKWLLSPWGVGFTYVREDLIQALEPAEAGWWAQASSGDYARFLEYDARWADDARRFEVITLDFVGFNAMAESIGLLLELGTAGIESHVAALGDRALAFADDTPGVEFVTPRERSRRAGVLAFRTKDVAASSERLVAAKVSHSVRTGCIRLAPHCYNTADELDQALAVLA
jgi:selenocysteine lyase/cysteine desulfurase